MDNFKKLNEQKENYEEAFGNVFNRKSKFQSNYVREKKNDVGYFLNRNPVTQFFSDGSENPFMDDTWQKTKNLWALNGVYNATTIHIKNNQISMNGRWVDGNFAGYEFFGTQSVFEGGSFNGQRYSAPNKSFLIEAHNYYSGVFINNKNGILGKSDIIQETTSSGIKSVELITIPIGWYVLLTDDKNMKFQFKITKRIDEISTEFKFLSLPTQTEVSVPWEDIRSHYVQRGYISQGRLFQTFSAPNFGTIAKIEIKKSIPLVINFSSHDGLKKFLKIKQQNIPFEVSPTSAESKAFTEQFLKDIPKQNGKFYRILNDLRTKVKNGVIKGHSGFNYLYQVFNNISGETIQDEETLEELQYLNDVVRYIGGDAVKIEMNGKEFGIEKRLINAIKSYLKTNLLKKQQTEEPGELGQSVSSDEKKAQFTQSQASDVANAAGKAI